MAYEHDPNRVEEGLSLLLEQYKTTVTTESMVEGVILDSQDSEDTARDMILDRSLETAVGAQLDRVGEDLDVSREGREDDDYRTKIKARIVRYQSSGQPSKVTDAFKLIAGVDTVHLKECFPAAIKLTGTNEEGDVDSDPADIAETLKNAKAAGVGIESIAIGKTPSFAFLGYPGDAAGFADEGIPDSGGFFVGIREDLRPQITFAFVGAPGDVAGFGDRVNFNPLTGGKFISE